MADKKLALSTISECVDTFAISTDVACFVMDSEGKQIYTNTLNKNLCKFCEHLKEMTGYSFQCSKAHEYGARQSERFGGKYIYFCPTGLAHFCSPLIIDAKTEGYLVGGPVLIIEKNEYIQFDLGEKYNLSDDSKKAIEKMLEDVVAHEPDRLSRLSSLLFMVALHLCESQTKELFDTQDFDKQQNMISEYIHELKINIDEVTSLPPYPINKEKELLTAISAGDKSESQRLLNEILGHIFFASGGNFGIIKARVLELVVLLSRAALEGGAEIEQIFGLNYIYLREINALKTVDEMSHWLSNIMNRFTKSVFVFAEVKHSDVIFKAIDFIKRNYKNKISLDEVANKVYLSPSYFSKIFKDEMKCNYNVYLNRLRIEKSKLLLLSDKVNLNDVATEVGFEDQSYYSKVFKKITGVTPGKFRESRGKTK
jgi:two-component system response regulator YesN